MSPEQEIQVQNVTKFFFGLLGVVHDSGTYFIIRHKQKGGTSTEGTRPSQTKTNVPCASIFFNYIHINLFKELSRMIQYINGPFEVIKF